MTKMKRMLSVSLAGCMAASAMIMGAGASNLSDSAVHAELPPLGNGPRGSPVWYVNRQLAEKGRHSATGLMAGIPLKLLWYTRQYNKAGNVFQSFGKHSLLLYLLACFRK